MIAAAQAITRPMILALADIHDEPVRIGGPRHINAHTVRALVRRKLVVVDTIEARR